MAKKEQTVKQRLNRIKRVSSKKLQEGKAGVGRALNINRYNRYLFMLETILLVGVIDEYFESLIMKVNYGVYLNILLLMLSIGVLFSFALKLIEPIARGTISWLVRLNDNKILRAVVHIAILYFLFCLYARVYFGLTISLVFNIGLNPV